MSHRSDGQKMLGKGDFEKYTVNNVELEKTVLRFLFFFF